MKGDAFLRCLLAIAVVAAILACAAGGAHLHAEAVAAGGVRVSPSDVFSNSSLLVVKVNILNDAGSPIVVDLDAARLTLADGRVLSPASHAKGAKTIEARESELGVLRRSWLPSQRAASAAAG